MRTYIDELERRRKVKIETLRGELKNEAVRLSRILLDSGFKFKKLYLFGSLVKKDRALFCWSDIDLVIEGLSQDLFYKAYALLLKKAKFNVDLKPFEDLDKTLKERLKQEGVVLYG